MRMRLSLSSAVLLTAVSAILPVTAAESCAAEFPFELREGLIWLKVSVRESAKPLNFLLDSGANLSVINLPAARQLGLAIGQPVEVNGVGATTTGYWPVHLRASCRSVPLPDDFLAIDLTKLSEASACPIDGLLGADFFAMHVVRIDFTRHKIYVDPVGFASAGQQSVSLRVKQGAIQVPVAVNNGASQWARLDTGCNTALHWVSAGTPPREAVSHVAVALAKTSIAVTQTSVQVGSYIFQDVPTGLHQTEIFPGEAGLLGTGLLSRFAAVTMDVASNRMLLESNRN
jgi:hypothetical protein